MMGPGQIVRRLLGPAFPAVGEAYRRLFVDMPRVVDAMIPHIPPAARVLDVGGGDGYVVNLLLTRRPDVRVTMTDIAPAVGSFISPENRPRVELRPNSQAAEVDGRFDVMTLADVVHHVPAGARAAFFVMLGETAARVGCAKVIIKDIRPGNLRAMLSLFSDLYVTGDRTVSLVPEDAIEVPGYRLIERTMPDFPNYCLTFAREV